jgi:hypothetical protein
MPTLGAFHLFDKRPETHFTLPGVPRPSRLDIELPFRWENQEHDEICG